MSVYDNNDNKPGPLSRKFRLDPNAGELVSRLKAPSISPEITEVLPLGPKSLRVGWTMNRRAFITKDSVEGYFIYYREKGGLSPHFFVKIARFKNLGLHSLT